MTLQFLYKCYKVNKRIRLEKLHPGRRMGVMYIHELTGVAIPLGRHVQKTNVHNNVINVRLKFIF